MVNYPKIYEGADYGLEPKYKESIIGNVYKFAPSTFGLPTDPRTANQLQAVSSKLSTGAKTIEVSGITPAVLESIPDQHLQEIKRLKKLSGINLTFHGPLVEPTGVSKQNWNESDREQAERQMWSALQRGRQMMEEGENLVVTFHSSNGLPAPETKIFNPETKKEEIKDVWLVDQRTGQFQEIHPRKDHFKGKELKTTEDINEAIKKENEDNWFRTLQHLNFNAHQGAKSVESALTVVEETEDGRKLAKIPKEMKESLLSLYNDFGSEQGKKKIDLLPNKEFINDKMKDIAHGEIYLREAYGEMQKIYNTAYEAAEREGRNEDLKKLNEFRNKIAPQMSDLNKQSNVEKLGDVIVDGVNVLKSISPPKTLTPLRDFALDKASETFSNLAIKSYKEFKESAPIISIENPPTGMGLSRGQDLKELVEKSQQKFIEKAKEAGMTESEARKQAEKLIGVTWDVGHINMIRKYGYDNTHLEEETKKIAPFVKHIHLSDNFGLEHTELPMGMGNVPLQKHIEVLKKQFGDKLKDIKQIVETGNWFEPFKTTPFAETLSAFGSPIYAMKAGPTWSDRGVTSGYFAGYGASLPDQHFSMYGAGFSQLPQELGGQIAGRSRLSGAPIE